MNKAETGKAPDDAQRPVLLAPSVLAADFGRLAEDVARVEAASDWLHLDVMDGRFVPNISFGQDVVAALGKETQLPLDVHLMIEEPERFLADFAEAGAYGLTVHVEACPHLHRTIQMIKELGCRAGVALNPHTPVATIKHVLDNVDLVLLMTVNPGFGGQRFLSDVLPKFDELAALLRASGRREYVDVQVDGGINKDTAAAVLARGANVLVAGSYVFGADDPRAALESLLQQ